MAEDSTTAYVMIPEEAHLSPLQEKASLNSAPSAPPAPPAPQAMYPTLLNPASIQDLQRQMEEMKTMLSKLQPQTPPKPALDFASLVELKDWKGALEALPQARSLSKSLLVAIIFGPETITGDLVALWLAILRTTRITPEQLDAIENESKKTALMNLVQLDITPDREIIAWVTKSASPAFLLKAMAKKYGKSDGPQDDLVAWTAFRQDARGLENLYNFKTSDGQLVFARTRDSSWNWPKFYKEVLSKAEKHLESGSVPNGFRTCIKFWIENVPNQQK